MTEYTIYAIRDSNGKAKYIGRTKHALKTRMYHHIKNGKIDSTHTIEKLEICTDYEVACALEREWIMSFLDRGVVLLNRSTGGKGASGYRYTDEQRIARSTQQSRLMNNPEYREIVGSKVRAQWRSEEFRAERLKRLRSPESRQKMSHAVRMAREDKELVERISKGIRQSWKDPEVRAKHLAARNKRFKCAACEYESNASGVGQHHKKTTHSGRIEV